MDVKDWKSVYIEMLQQDIERLKKEKKSAEDHYSDLWQSYTKMVDRWMEATGLVKGNGDEK